VSSLSVEILVVGGGPVGSAVALELHRAGKEVLLIDAGASADKVCGEGLLPPGWRALEALGVASLVDEKAPIAEIAYRLPCPRTGAMRQLVAPLHSPSFGVKRDVLCRAFARAGERAGLPVWRPARLRALAIGETTVRATVEHGPSSEIVCRRLIGADGLHSAVRRLAGLDSDQPRSFSRWGTRVYLRDRPGKGVSVTLGAGMESYMTPLGGDLFGLSFIWCPQTVGRPLPGEGPIWRRLLALFPPSFRETLPPEEAFFGSERAIGPLEQRASPLHPSGLVALAGDAAGYFDALTGEGLCLGMLQAAALSAALLGGGIGSYPALHRAIKRRHQLVINLLLRLLERPSLRERVYSSLLEAPEVFAALVATAVEHHPWHRLLTPKLLRFLRLMLTPGRSI
jgi:2-polyprenyl-6-methoxyphenol hydroxylase-like FAD-dependent oxidoreductase